MDLNGSGGGGGGIIVNDDSGISSTSNFSSSVKCTIRKNQLLASIPNYGKPYKTFTIQLNNIEKYFGTTTGTTTTTTTTTATSTATTGTSTIRDNQQQQNQQNVQTIEWNKSYIAAQQIFNETSTQSKLIRKAIHSAYNRLYVGSTIGITPMKHITLYNSIDLLNTVFKVSKYYTNTNTNTITTTGSSVDDDDNKDNNNFISDTIDSNKNNNNNNNNKIMYTYVIMPNGEWRFSKTYHPILDETHNVLRNKVQDNTSGIVIDFMSKHALMSNCSRSVVYAGEFYIQKVVQTVLQTTNNITTNTNDTINSNNQYILIIDNGSGTYSPKGTKEELYKLQLLLQNNFPGLIVIAHHYTHLVTIEELTQATLNK